MVQAATCCPDDRTVLPMSLSVLCASTRPSSMRQRSSLTPPSRLAHCTPRGAPPPALPPRAPSQPREPLRGSSRGPSRSRSGRFRCPGSRSPGGRLSDPQDIAPDDRRSTARCPRHARTCCDPAPVPCSTPRGTDSHRARRTVCSGGVLTMIKHRHSLERTKARFSGFVHAMDQAPQTEPGAHC